MKVVFSFFSCLNSSNPYYDNKNILLDLLMAASYSARKCGFTTCLVYDEFFSLSSEHRDSFNEVKIISKQEISDMKLPNIAGSSIGKLLCLKYINEPFIYLNPGFFIYKDGVKKIIEDNIDCFVYSEIIPNTEDGLKEAIMHKSKILGLDILEVATREVFNDTQIIGGNNYKLINNAAERLLKFITKNGHYLEKEILQNKSYYEKFLCNHLIDLDSIIDNYWLPSFLSSESDLKVSCLINSDNGMENLIKGAPPKVPVNTKIDQIVDEKKNYLNELRSKIQKRIFNYKTGLLVLPPVTREEDLEKLKKIKHKMLNEKISKSI